MTAASPPVNRRRLGSLGWPIGFTLAVILIFIFYRYWLPDSVDSVQKFVADWFPPAVINQCVIWVIMAIGLNVVVGYAGLLDLGYVAFWAIGTYVGAWLMSGWFFQVHWHIGGPPTLNKAPGIHISFWLVVIFAGAFCALWGVLIGAPTLRLRSDYLAIVTLGFGEIIPQVFANGDSEHLGFALTNGEQSIVPIDGIGTGPFSQLKGVNPQLGVFDLPYRFIVFCLVAAFCVFVSLRLRRGRLGRAWLAIREDELAASMMGVSLVRAKLSSYAVGAFFGGMGGVCYAVAVGGASPNFSFSNSITILMMVVLGGMGNVWGVIIGALLVSWVNLNGLSQFGSWYNGQFNTNIDFPSYNFLIFGIILVLMMLFRREGLLPESRTRLIMREPSRTEMEDLGADIEAAEEEDEVILEEESEDELVGTETTGRSDGGAS
jgi:branched-chain amino acid transport system permease protein